MNREGEYKRTIVQVSLLITWHQNRGPQLSPGRAHRRTCLLGGRCPA